MGESEVFESQRLKLRRGALVLAVLDGLAVEWRAISESLARIL